MSHHVITFACVILVPSLLGCSEKRDEHFYSKYEASDVLVAPVLDPYFIASTTGPNGIWYLDDGNGGVRVSYVATVDSVITSYFFDRAITNPSKRDTTWYIHLPRTRHMYQFSSKADFIAQLQLLASSMPSFSRVESVYGSHAAAP